MPEIFQLSGAVLREVGTTNRTSVNDYAEAIGPETVAIMHVHTSNYKVVGFSDTPGIDLLAPLAHEHGLVAIDDIGSGAMVDVAQFGLPAEPTFAESLAAGADVVLGSGDKLLGGPQAGIILGKSQYVEPIRQFPLARAVRVGKLTLAALPATLGAYRRGDALAEVPVRRRLAAPARWPPRPPARSRRAARTNCSTGSCRRPRTGRPSAAPGGGQEGASWGCSRECPRSRRGGPRGRATRPPAPGGG